MVLLASVGIIFFTIRLAVDPANWVVHGTGVAVCVYMWVRHAKVGRSNRTIASSPSLHVIHDEATLGEVLASDHAVLYKHSTRCPVSAIVIDEVRQFGETHPSWPVYVIQVIEHRRLSDIVAERLAVRHESPQALIINEGRCVWDTSHNGITAQRLSQHVASESK